MPFKGINAAPGLAIGPCLVLDEIQHPDLTNQKIGDEQVLQEIDKLEGALTLAGKQLSQLFDRASAAGLNELAAVIQAHQMMLEDPRLTEQFLAGVATDHLTAAGAVQKAIKVQAVIFEKLDDAYLRERANDIRDIGRRLVNLLLGFTEPDIRLLPEPLILVARNITPSMMATVNVNRLLGIVAEIGGKNSHTAILANHLGIPAVLGCQSVVTVAKAQPCGTLVAVDGSKGLVHIGVTREQEAILQADADRRAAVKVSLASLKDQPTLTKDGVAIRLAANVMGPGDVEKVLAVGAEGVGLYRTEFLFMDRDKAPEEEEQYLAYRAVVEGLGGRPVIIRTVDIGGDKPVNYLNLPKNENPFLDCRSLLVCLEHDDLFLTQLRAILRAAVHGQALILFPMVRSVDEVRAAKTKLDQARHQLRLRGEPFAESIKIGVMVEIPSTAVIADRLIQEVDFLSIGSNDLTQYTLAVDRTNESIRDLYNCFHPAVLRLVKSSIDAALKAGGAKFASLCGEMAGDPRATLLLLGLGLQEFSVAPANLLLIRKIINSVDFAYARSVAEKAMQLGTISDVENDLTEALPEALRIYFDESI
jgi:phosphotransferase system enzyme I (PtsI)